MGQRKPCRMEAEPPPGPIKCLINSRRMGRNNEHLSESFIAYKTLSPEFSHLIFTTGLGGRYYHYLHFIGEESESPTPNSSAWVGCIPGEMGEEGLDSGSMIRTCFLSPGGCHNLSSYCRGLKG